MSYQFDTTRLRTATSVKVSRDVTSARLLARRTARQTRRAQRAL